MHKIRLHQIFGVLILLLGATVMLGWWTGQQALVQVMPGFVAMVFNTALCFFLTGLALLAPEFKAGSRQRTQGAIGIALIAIAALVGLQNLTNIHFGIDQLFARVWFTDSNPHPGRMPPQTTIGFLLIGACFILLRHVRATGAVQWMVQILILATIALGIAGLIGYSLKLDLLYGWYRFARMAPHTAGGFLLAGASLWLIWHAILARDGAFTHREDRRINTLVTMLLLVLALTAGLTGFILSAHRTEAALRQNLEAAHANRVQLLSFVVDDAMRQTQTLAADPTLLARLEKAQAGPAGSAHVPGILEQHLARHEFSAVALHSGAGQELVKIGRFAGHAAINLPLQQNASLLWDNTSIVLEIRSTVGQGNARQGLLVTQLRLPIIQNLLSDASLLGATGDILICAAIEPDAMSCLPSRQNLQGFARLPRLRDGQPLPMHFALNKTSGVINAFNYRGQQVVAAFGPVADTRLGIVVELDAVELYQPIRSQFEAMLAILAILFTLGLGLMRWQLLPLVTALLQARRDAAAGEATARKLLERFDLVSRATNDTVWDWDFSANEIWWNEGITQTFGHPPQQIEADASWWTARIHPDDRKRIIGDIDAEVDNGGQSWSGEYRFQRANGSYAHVLDRGHIIRDESGKAMRMIGAMMDISARKEAEALLRASEDRFSKVFNLSPVAITVSRVDDGMYLDANQAACELLGYRREELIGSSSLSINVWISLQERSAMLKRLQMQGSVRDFEMQLRTRSGAIISVLFSADVVELAGVPYMLCLYNDITERKRVEQQLEQSRQRAEAANAAKSEFLANMSHEIRTPMNGVIGLTGLMLKTPLTEQQREYMTLIKSSAGSLLRLLNDILDFSKMEARKLELDITVFDLRETIGDALKVFSVAANEKGIELAYQVAPGVPNLVLGDQGRLSQVFVNLVGNALKFTSQGEVVVRIDARMADANRVLLQASVADTGIGISAEQQTYIFNAFSQADSSTTRRFGGTGLGLAIVSQLLALMHGTIRVESTPGHGTTFHITAKLDLPTEQPAANAYRKPAKLKNLPVLVVDDNRSNRMILTEMLANWDMQPSQAESVEQALDELGRAAARGTPFALALLDSRMPQRDGFELACLIQSNPAFNGATIMMLSSSDIAGEIERCKILNIHRFLRKPIKHSELFNAIAAALGMAAGGTTATGDARAVGAQPARLLRVLVAEDHPVNQRLVADILAERGHSFALAGNGAEALRLLEAEPFDVILMDGQMPEMDGYQAAAEIRRREQASGAHIRIIAVTAHAMKEDRDICLAAGMDDYIAKPIDPEQLIELLEQLPTQMENSVPVSGMQTARGNSSAQPAFDNDAALKRVRGKTALLTQLIDAFLQDVPATLTALQSAVAAQDGQQLERAAHRLKGAASTLCASSTVQAAAMLERLGREQAFGEPVIVETALQELEQRIAELKLALKDYL